MAVCPAAAAAPRLAARLLLAALLVMLVASAWPSPGIAHEAWVLDPATMAERNARPRPEIFTHLTAANAVMLTTVLIGVVAWARLGAIVPGRAMRLVADRLRAHEHHASLVLRIGLALTLVMAALGLHPRHGTALLEAPALAFPDLELRLLGDGWGWLAWLELALAAGLLIRSGVRWAAVGVLLLTALGALLFGTAMLAYAGALVGAAAYLVVRGARRPWDGAPQAHERALFLVRVLTGATFLWCGIHYKVLQPNLVLAIIVEGGVPTFGLGPDVFVFGMALVEVSVGALMMAGVLVRPLTLVLFAAFLFLGGALGENPLGHALFYGNLAVLGTGGAGRWRGEPARAGPARRPAVAASTS